MVHLIKRARREPEPQPQQLVLDISRAVQDLFARSEDGISLFGIVAGNDAGNGRFGGKQRLAQLLSVWQFGAICHHAHQKLPRFLTHAQIDMADAASMRAFVIRADTVLLHPRKNGRAHTVGAAWLDAAAFHSNDLVRTRAEKACGRAAVLLRDRELHLVAVSLTALRAVHGKFRYCNAADARERVDHALPLEPALLLIVHMPEVAAAADGKIGTARRYPVRRCRQYLFDLRVRAGLSDVYDARAHRLAGDRAGNEYHFPTGTGHALSV